MTSNQRATPFGRPWLRLSRPSPPVVASVVSLIVAGLVVAPWTRRGWLLLLDWIPGPHHSSLPRAFWGLDGTLQTAMPFALIVLGAGRLVGAALAGWLVVALALSLAGVAAGHLVGGPPIRRIAAGTLYAVNPFVFERTYAGQVGFLLAYAVLPLVVASMLRWRDDLSWRGLRPALWLALAIGFSPHLIWIAGVVLVWHVLVRRCGRRAMAWTSLLVVVTLLVSAYAIVPALGRSTPLRVGEEDLIAFRTRGDPTFGILGNVAGLYGFWRAEPRLPKEDVAGWPVLLVAIGLVSASGLWSIRRHEEQRHVTFVLVLSAATGAVLALGDQGPSGPAFRWLFDHLPGFDMMREPQKFVALVALAYAFGFGHGVESLLRAAKGRPGKGLAAAALLLPFLYTPNELFGLNGQVGVSRVPDSWARADRVMAAGDGKVLFLPWHQYLSFPFTGRVIGNPAEPFFRREAIAGDNVELANRPTSSRLRRSEYLEYLYASGSELCAFGRLVEPLGVEYVALTNVLDFERYSWLNDQVDLEIVLDAPEITLYRNLSYNGLGSRSAALGRAADWGELASLANTGSLTDGPYVVDAQRPGPLSADACRAVSPSRRPDVPVARRSPVSYRVEPGERGYVTLAEPFDESWRLDDGTAVELAGGTLALPSDGRGGTARFGHWRVVRAAYALSAGTIVVVLGGPYLRPVWTALQRLRRRDRGRRLPGEAAGASTGASATATGGEDRTG